MSSIKIRKESKKLREILKKLTEKNFKNDSSALSEIGMYFWTIKPRFKILIRILNFLLFHILTKIISKFTILEKFYSGHEIRLVVFRSRKISIKDINIIIKYLDKVNRRMRCKSNLPGREQRIEVLVNHYHVQLAIVKVLIVWLVHVAPFDHVLQT